MNEPSIRMMTDKEQASLKKELLRRSELHFQAAFLLQADAERHITAAKRLRAEATILEESES